MTGKFFALEGLECSGKTTLFNTLKERLKNTDTEFISEAAGRFAALSPDIYKDKEAMEIAYIIDNAITISKVDELLRKDTNVIMDRTWLCQLVYARTRKALNSLYKFNTGYIERQEEILKSLFPEVFANTIVIYLNIPIRTILKRGKESNSHHRKGEVNEAWLREAEQQYKNRLDEAKRNGTIVEHIDAGNHKKVTDSFEKIFEKHMRR